MNSFSILWQIILADFRERTRRYSYLITLMVALFVGYLVLTGKYSYLFGPFKPVYNSHWVGTTVALAGAALFTMIGFYIVRTSISRDRETRVGEILATTRLSNFSYLLAKFTSNLLVLWSMVAALAVTAYLGMLANVPFHLISFTAFITPFVLFTMVITVPVAGAAVLFDTARWLRGAVGNVLYFFLAEFLIVSGLLKIPYFDAAGMGLLEASIKGTIAGIYPGEKIPMTIGFVGFAGDLPVEAVKTFVWNGLDYTFPLLASRLIWPSLALVMLLLAVLLFDRFEQSKRVSRKKKVKKYKAVRLDSVIPRHEVSPVVSYKSIPSVKFSSGIVPLVIAELKLGFKELNRVWLLIGLAIFIAELVVPFDIVRKYILPAAMIWPLVLWSSMGTREERFNMRSLIFCSAGAHSRQYLALLVSGIAVALAMCMPMFVRAGMAGEFAYLVLLVSSALLIPTAAFALGVVSGSRKLFEVFYLIVWYGGSIDHISQIDLLGTVEESTSFARVSVFVVIAMGAALVAYVGRHRRAEV